MKKIPSLLLALAFASFSSHARAGAGTEITEQNAPLIYEVKADIPTPPEILAAQISRDYRNLRDEFSRHEFLEKLKPTIERKIKEASTTETFSIPVGTRLEEYDFNRKGFPTGMGTQSFIPLGQYAVRFTNPEAAGFVPVSLDDAKKAAPALKSTRNCIITYFGSLEKSGEEPLNYGAYKVIYLKVNKIAIKLEAAGTEFIHEIR